MGESRTEMDSNGGVRRQRGYTLCAPKVNHRGTQATVSGHVARASGEKQRRSRGEARMKFPGPRQTSTAGSLQLCRKSRFSTDLRHQGIREGVRKKPEIVEAAVQFAGVCKDAGRRC